MPPSDGYSWVNGELLANLSALPAWPDDLRPTARSAERTPSATPQADAELVAAALAVIPNNELGWDDWNRIGMATFRATAGSDTGLAAFTAWSEKSKKYDADQTAERWQHYATSPPDEIGAGTLFHLANEADPGWRVRAVAAAGFPDVTKGGWPRATLPNTKVALTKLGVECRHDLFKLRYVVNGQEIESFVGEVSDPALLRLREMIYERFRFDTSTQTVHTAVMTLANHHRFHPVCDYLDGLKWDGVPRLDNWLINYGGAEDSEYVRAVGALVLTAAVRRVRQPGCKFDEILVLENEEQGTNKSQALQVLAVEREWFSDNLPLGLSPKETIEALSGHWIMEASELHGMRNSEIEKVKAFASRDTDRARMAYDRAPAEARRQCVIIGTTNSKKYLRDRTGNRRFWPVEVERFNLETLKRDRDQLWAEAAAREADGASIRLPERLWAAAAAEQQERMIENPFKSVLDQVLREKDEMVEGTWVEGKPMEGKIMSEDVWTILEVRPAQRSQDKLELLGDAMKQLGWERIRLRVGERQRAYFYLRGSEPHKRINVCGRAEGSGPTAFYENQPQGESGKPGY